MRIVSDIVLFSLMNDPVTHSLEDSGLIQGKNERRES
jgi:uncharacterized membrane protein